MSFINNLIKKYVLSNQKLAAEIIAGINDKVAKKKADDLLKQEKNFIRGKYGQPVKCCGRCIPGLDVCVFETED